MSSTSLIDMETTEVEVSEGQLQLHRHLSAFAICCLSTTCWELRLLVLMQTAKPQDAGVWTMFFLRSDLALSAVRLYVHAKLRFASVILLFVTRAICR